MLDFSRTISGFKKVFAGRTFNSVIAILISIIIVRSLGTKVYGQWVLMHAVFSVIFGVLGFKTGEALSRYLAKSEHVDYSKKFLVYFSLVLDFSVAILLFLIGGYFLAQYNYLIFDSIDFSINFVLAYGVVFLATFPLKSWHAVVRESESYWHLTLQPIAINSLKLLVLVWLYASNLLNIENLVLLFVLLAIVDGTWKLIVVLRWVKRIDSQRITIQKIASEVKILKTFFDMLLNGFLTSAITSLVKKIDVLILGFWHDDSEVGIYALGKRIVLSLQSPFQLFGKLMFRDMSSVVDSGSEKQNFAALLSFTVQKLPVLSFISLLVGVFSWWVVPFFFGLDFAHSAMIICILLVGVTISSSLLWVYPLFISLERFREFLRITLVNSAIVIVGYLVFIPNFGGIAAAAFLSLGWALGHLLILKNLRDCIRLE